MILSINQSSDKVGRYTFTQFHNGFDINTYVEIQEPHEDFVLHSYNKNISECPYSFLGFGTLYSSFSLLNKIHFFDSSKLAVVNTEVNINKEEYERMKELDLDLSKLESYKDIIFSCNYITVLESDHDISY